MTTGLPVHHRGDQLAAQGITLKYISSPTGGIMENPPHFSDWAAQEERNQLRTSILEAGGKGALLPASWAERTQRTFKAWWAFYLTQYPANLEHKQNKKRPSYFTAIDTPQKTKKTEPDTSNRSDEPHSEQSEAGVSGLAGFYMSNFAHLDPAIICSRFSPEIVGLCIFLLVPAAVMIVEIVDMLHDRWTTEQFPERGRGRERLTGPERQHSLLAKYEREKAAMDDQSQKWWGQRKRSK
jgi:hypothetical protein